MVIHVMTACAMTEKDNQKIINFLIGDQNYSSMTQIAFDGKFLVTMEADCPL